jgi:hypothetical protein
LNIRLIKTGLAKLKRFAFIFPFDIFSFQTFLRNLLNSLNTGSIIKFVALITVIEFEEMRQLNLIINTINQ